MHCNKKIPSKTLYRKYKTLILKHQNGSEYNKHGDKDCLNQKQYLKNKQIEESRLILCAQ